MLTFSTTRLMTASFALCWRVCGRALLCPAGEKIGEAGESVTGFQGEAPGVKDGSGWPVRVSVDLIPSMLETLRVMKSMAC